MSSGQGPAPTDDVPGSVAGQGSALLDLKDVGTELANAKSVKDIEAILARVPEPNAWTRRPELYENPVTLANVRSRAFRLLALAIKRQAEDAEKARVDAREAALRGRGRKRATRKRKHFRKRTSRKH